MNLKFIILFKAVISRGETNNRFFMNNESFTSCEQFDSKSNMKLHTSICSISLAFSIIRNTDDHFIYVVEIKYIN